MKYDLGILTGNLNNLAETCMQIRRAANGVEDGKEFRELMAAAETILRDVIEITQRAAATRYGQHVA
jgi:hypothetical protein